MIEVIKYAFAKPKEYEICEYKNRLVVELLTKRHEPDLKQGWKLHYDIELVSVET